MRRDCYRMLERECVDPEAGAGRGGTVPGDTTKEDYSGLLCVISCEYFIREASSTSPLALAFVDIFIISTG